MDQRRYKMYIMLASTAEEIIQLSETLNLPLPDAIEYWMNEYERGYDEDFVKEHPGSHLMPRIYKILEEMCFYRASSVIPDESVLKEWDEQLDYFILIKDIASKLEQPETLN